MVYRVQLFADHVAAHVRMLQHRLRLAIGDDPPLVEREHAMRVPADDVHIVLDEEHGDALRGERGHHHVHQPELLIGGYAAGRFVEQQHARATGHRHGDVE
jgi:hypothetical protein